MENQSDNKNVISPWSFRDGKEYMVSVSVNDKPRSLGILISDKITAEEWSCHYDLKYIEDLTQRTGNYKPFNTFVTMIKCAILKNSEAVALDLMTYDDLKFIKSKRHREGIVITNDYPATLLTSAETGNQPSTSSESTLSKRKYLIVTYVAEFDTVHYPIPLHYSGPPDPLVMQNNIKKLQAEVNHLKNTNSQLRGKLSVRNLEDRDDGHNHGNQNLGSSAAEIFVRAKSRGRNPNRRNSVVQPQIEELPNIQPSRNNPNTGLGVEAKQISAMEIDQMSKLLSSIHRLELKIVTERTEHLHQMEKLQVENSYLRDRINELQQSEQALNLQIGRLETMFERQSAAASRKASLVHLHSKKKIISPKQKQFNYRTRTTLSRPKSPYQPAVRGIPLPRSAPVRSAGRRGPYYENIRSRPASNEGIRRPGPIRSTGFSLTKPRSRTVSPTPYFNPTTYVREKQMRQDEISKLRMERIHANLLKPGRISNTKDVSTSRERGRSMNQSRNGNISENSSQCETDARPSRPFNVISRRQYRLTRHSSVSQSPPRNTEMRLAQRKQKLHLESRITPISRGRSIERRTSSRTLAGQRETGISNRFRIFDSENAATNTSIRNSAQVSKSTSVAWMTEDETNKLFQFSKARENPEPSKTFLLKDLEGSLDALQAFVNTTNQGYNGLR